MLKPNDEYGGKGVVLGWTVDAREWEQAFLAALTSSYVVQERVDVPREALPVPAPQTCRGSPSGSRRSSRSATATAS
ncbi:MAG: circularly permuted type 2 ATP-grasp protein [Chloroflexi bacterium]|nr:circularly permuted type 2 ATP-grasp protein [Chloroflexota bacterium]